MREAAAEMYESLRRRRFYFEILFVAYSSMFGLLLVKRLVLVYLVSMIEKLF